MPSESPELWLCAEGASERLPCSPSELASLSEPDALELSSPSEELSEDAAACVPS